MPQFELPQAEFKLVMLGETFTGKTSLVLRFAEGYYRESSRNPTVGAFFITKRLAVQGMTAKIQIWDTAGQEQFKKLAPMYYKSAAAAIVCYDVTSPKSFETLEYWMNELQTNVPEGIVIGMCATKCDLDDDPDTSQAEALAEEHGAIFLKTSSKNNSNVQLLFEKVAEKVLEKHRENADTSNVTLGVASPPASPRRSPKSSPMKGNSTQQFATPTALPDNEVTASCSPFGNDVGVCTSPFVEEKKTADLDVSNDLVEPDSDIPDDSSAKHAAASRCESTKLMCGSVVGISDENISGCAIQ